MMLTYDKHVCPECEGCGEVVINRASCHAYGGMQDPQYDDAYECRRCGGTGSLLIPCDEEEAPIVLQDADDPCQGWEDYTPTDLCLAGHI